MHAYLKEIVINSTSNSKRSLLETILLAIKRKIATPFRVLQIGFESLANMIRRTVTFNNGN